MTKSDIIPNRFFINSGIMDIRVNFLLFIIWPFLAFIASIWNYSRKESRIVVYLFFLYYGANFVIIEGLDSFAYASRLQHNADLPFSDFFKVVGGLYSGSSVDIFEPFISFIISRFTDSHNIYFAIWTGIFGFFYLKSINLLYDKYQTKSEWSALFFLWFFALILPVTTINGIRMPTATWIFFLGAYQVIVHRNPMYFILAFGSVLVHWSFLSVTAILIIYYFLGNRNLLYFILVVFSFIVPEFLAPYFGDISSRLGGALLDRYERYSNDAYIEYITDSHSKAVWFIVLRDNLVFYYVLFCSFFLHLKYKDILKNKPLNNLFSFSLLFLALINFGKIIPTFGGRFQQVFLLFAVAYIFLVSINLARNRINFLVYAGLFPLLIYTSVTFRNASDNINAWILTPIFGSPLLTPVLSLSDVLFK
jgi:hypothetical protein